LRFGPLLVETEGDRHLFDVQVYLDELDRDAIRVELYAEPVDGGAPIQQEMIRGESLIAAGNAYHYSASVPASRSPSDYTPRIVPYHPGAFIPLEATQILWYR
jgi:starch phosphorylase